MRVAIPVCRGRVSPLFDEACQLLIAEVVGDRVRRRRATVLGPDRVRGLTGNGVEVLLCGAVSADLRRRLAAAGVDVHAWMRGEAGEVLDAYVTGRLAQARFRLPGAGTQGAAR